MATTSKEQEDNIIRNPERHREKSYAPYVPEHIRLGRSPVVQELASLDGEILDQDLPLEKEKSTTRHTVPISNPTVPAIGDFILMVFGTIIARGTQDYVLEEAKLILYGEHSNFRGAKVKIDDLVVLKRVGLKVGVFFSD